MVTIKLEDKRYPNGHRLKFFKTNEIKDEIIEFVRKNPKVSQISLYMSREELLEKVGKNNPYEENQTPL